MLESHWFVQEERGEYNKKDTEGTLVFTEIEIKGL
jgi:hypothetical protein